MRITITTRIDGHRVVADPMPLLAAVPALLGFIPERSIILLCMDDDPKVIATMRHDLARTSGGRPPAALTRLLTRLGGLSAGYGASQLVAVFVDDRLAPEDSAHRALAREIRRAFAAAVPLVGAFAVRELDAGQPWHTVWSPGRPRGLFPVPLAAHGVLADPLTCPAAVNVAVEHGRWILRRRSDAEAMLAAQDCTCDTCARGAPSPALLAADDREHLAAVYDEIITRACGGGPLTCEQVHRVGVALAAIRVRDALLGLCLTVHRDAAESLWMELTRRLSGTPRAAAATLLGYGHYLAGAGAFAAIAFDVAHQADPSYALANLLDSALVHGIRPSALIGLADVSFGVARTLGITVPPATYSVAG